MRIVNTREKRERCSREKCRKWKIIRGNMRLEYCVSVCFATLFIAKSFAFSWSRCTLQHLPTHKHKHIYSFSDSNSEFAVHWDERSGFCIFVRFGTIESGCKSAFICFNSFHMYQQNSCHRIAALPERERQRDSTGIGIELVATSVQLTR